ncbi:MAG: hypothetical protein HQL56_15210 [Magnetococcales bacterium]|nr:hypothetical protein [Magnetococcales bacterium]
MITYSHTRLIILLLLLCLILEIGLSLKVDLVKGLPVSKPTNNNDGVVEAVQLARLPTVVPLDLLRETLERPLFSKDRMRLAKKYGPNDKASLPQAAPTRALDPPSLQVIGILLLDNGRHALIRRSQGISPEWISENDKVDGWVLDGVLPTRIILKNGEQLETISLENGPPLKGTNPPATSK